MHICAYVHTHGYAHRSYGLTPYWQIADDSIARRVVAGERLEPPQDCPAAVYDIMQVHIGHDHIGHNYVGHIGRTYVGHTHTGHACIALPGHCL